ncbi:hypothetical protein GN956_G23749 [Arapaima gigas]
MQADPRSAPRGRPRADDFTASSAARGCWEGTKLRRGLAVKADGLFTPLGTRQQKDQPNRRRYREQPGCDTSVPWTLSGCAQ